ncbi:MAG: OmpA family protein [Chitinophagales bacterium]
MRQLSLTLFLVIVCSMAMVAQEAHTSKTNLEFYDIQSLPLNSQFADFNPVFFEDGIIFCSDRPDSKLEKASSKYIDVDYYFATRKGDNDYAKPVKLKGEINSKFDEGTATVTSNDRYILFSRINRTNPNDTKAKWGIYVAKVNEKEQWEITKHFRYNSERYNIAHPSVSADNNYLFFISDMRGGQGGTDIYVCKRMNGHWGKPKNLGPTVNTNKDEMFPFIHADGTLYFASSGHEGLGGLDIYQTTSNANMEEVESWNTPQNLGKEINSSSNDFGFILNEESKSGYFCSNRKSKTGGGEDDLFSFHANIASNNNDAPSFLTNKLELDTTPEEKGIAKNTKVATKKPTPKFEEQPQIDRAKEEVVVEKKTVITQEAKPATVEANKTVVAAAKANKEPLEKKIIKSTKADEVVATTTRKTPQTLPQPETQTAKTTTANPQSTFVSLPAKNYASGIKMPILNDQIGIEQIDFKPKQAQLTTTAQKELDKLIRYMHQNKELQVELTAHTDSRGDNRSNWDLSGQRAAAARDYLINKGKIDFDRITAKGYGEKHLLNHCKDGMSCPDDFHEINNRIEVRWVAGNFADTPTFKATLAGGEQAKTINIQAKTVSSPIDVDIKPVEQKLEKTTFKVEIGPFPTMNDEMLNLCRNMKTNMSLNYTAGGEVIALGPFETVTEAREYQQNLKQKGVYKTKIGFNTSYNVVKKAAKKSAMDVDVKKAIPKMTYEVYVGPFRHVKNEIHHKLQSLGVKTRIEYTNRGMMVVLGKFDSQKEATAFQQKALSLKLKNEKIDMATLVKYEDGEKLVIEKRKGSEVIVPFNERFNK